MKIKLIKKNLKALNDDKVLASHKTKAVGGGVSDFVCSGIEACDVVIK
ncbi:MULTISPECIES: hypothetical protein [Pseudoalteromonas]|uniref:Uncharacterized protein n=1 Tax=Pseudoalteromonas luteoviolacea (strain 2ta16) TaxID=1353533 RepID=V4HUW0_PSEL2|nr:MULTISPECIES: hypothetical protein [Pseudoalteromonas]ESP91704.1 hypothetical protein PL2TA16_05344 [Pseudoalteromonas luteoviolacea 2ta16]KZN40816.1 hypothetical protein N483_16955 [Pseudoalteromonas luteoviolacea NCIMB 1944]MCG7546691.1 hypothetical protein [Pseudoalteromonas sp. Of7M-16]